MKKFRKKFVCKAVNLKSIEYILNFYGKDGKRSFINAFFPYILKEWEKLQRFFCFCSPGKILVESSARFFFFFEKKL